MFLQEGDGCRGVAGDIFVRELHELADEGGQVAGGLSVVLQKRSSHATLQAEGQPETLQTVPPTLLP